MGPKLEGTKQAGRLRRSRSLEETAWQWQPTLEVVPGRSALPCPALPCVPALPLWCGKLELWHPTMVVAGYIYSVAFGSRPRECDMTSGLRLSRSS